MITNAVFICMLFHNRRLAGLCTCLAVYSFACIPFPWTGYNKAGSCQTARLKPSENYHMAWLVVPELWFKLVRLYQVAPDVHFAYKRRQNLANLLRTSCTTSRIQTANIFEGFVWQFWLWYIDWLHQIVPDGARRKSCLSSFLDQKFAVNLREVGQNFTF